MFVRANLKWLHFQVCFWLLWRRVWFYLFSLNYMSVSWRQLLLKLPSSIFLNQCHMSILLPVSMSRPSKIFLYFEAFLCMLSACLAKCFLAAVYLGFCAFYWNFWMLWNNFSLYTFDFFFKLTYCCERIWNFQVSI